MSGELSRTDKARRHTNYVVKWRINSFVEEPFNISDMYFSTMPTIEQVIDGLKMTQPILKNVDKSMIVVDAVHPYETRHAEQAIRNK